MSEKPVFDKIAIIGVGLLGSSIAHAVKAYGGARHVALFDHDNGASDLARNIVPGDVADTITEAVSEADAVFLCTPVGTLRVITEAIAPDLKPGAILTDVGSVKLVAAADMLAASHSGTHVIPGHPIAGTEESGPSAGFASLFQGAWHILTPTDNQSADYMNSVDRLSHFWTGLGAKVETMDAAHHDRVLAITSHLPHLIAFNIVSTAYDIEQIADKDVVKYSAGGFRDFTRIAASDPVMWRDVFLANKDAVLDTLGRFTEDLNALQKAIRNADGDQLIKEFTRARNIRKAIVEAGLDTDKADFGRRSDETPHDDA
ncbi:MAG: prephenate/arogenate dehydrogenase family protein [Pseudomonadota bacterium]